jgi:uncharacterized repeat protein (TIGR01451 family)
MPEPDRPSRQDLVVPPRSSKLPIILGACGCACAGFGLVWGLGIGRVRPAPESPGMLATTDDATAQAVPTDGWRAPAPEPEPAATPSTDRYAQRVSLDEVDAGEVVPAAAEGRPLSRFAAAAQDPLPAAGAATEPPRELDRDQPPGSRFTTPAESVSETSAAKPDETAPVTPTPGAVPVPLTENEDEVAIEADPAPPVTEPVDEATETTAPDTVAVEPPPAALGSPAPPHPFSPPPGNTLTAQPPGAALTAPPPAASPGMRASAPPAAFAAPPPQLATAAVPQPPPFAGPQPPSPFNAPPSPPAASPPPSDSATGATGQGRPGPMQLDGAQTPQVTVEKRGPREVQVGKPARYEIVVRNVGSAVAHDVTLRDAIPAGTSLITTTPPASPASGTAEGGAGELVWMLGILAPGNETKVALEVMPEAEGEIGSVASVVFRAEASIRSRSTKPALQLDFDRPEPVLIGKPINVAIKVSNPGTGVATGVVLEGVLPDGITHRAGRELEFDVGQLRPGETRSIDLSLATSAPGVHAMRLVARADGRLEVEQALPLEVTAPTLEIAAEMPARRYLQRPATCRITMSNTGTAPAKAVELATQLPPGMKFVRANNAGYYDERTHRVLWSLEELPPGDAGTVEVVVMPVSLGPQKFVTAARNADGLSDQMASTIEVEGLAALSFEVSDSEDPIEVDGQTEYVIRVGNQGTKAASGVRLSATLLGEMEPLDAKGPAAHRIENLTVLFEPLARLAPSEEASFRIRVRGRREGDQRVQVQITSDDHPAPITKEEITRVYSDR